ncbi:PHP domain-containing protein [Candidatus Saccharibacteria bacterium]|nr:PHP domain-containing protein [Candidatus Saccharibacteria bacterium]
MQYKTEIHLHTKMHGDRGFSDPDELVRLHKDAGYSTIIVTDHYSADNLGKIDGSWDEKMDYLVGGFKKALAAGEKIGLNVLLGTELTLVTTQSDYLIYGINEAFMRENPNLHCLNLRELVDVVNKNGWLAIQAHPFRLAMQLVPPELGWPIETWNGGTEPEANEEAERYAREHNLIGLATSDYHEPADLGLGAILTDVEITNIEQFIEIVRARKFTNIHKDRVGNKGY